MDDTKKGIDGSIGRGDSIIFGFLRALNKIIAKETCGIPVSRLGRNERVIRTTKECLQSG